jgi:hypothetical protein
VILQSEAGKDDQNEEDGDRPLVDPTSNTVNEMIYCCVAMKEGIVKMARINSTVTIALYRNTQKITVRFSTPYR